MSDKDYYPAGAYDDPNAPYNQPDPIEDSDEFQDEKLAMWTERISDPDYALEALGERDTADIKRLAHLIVKNQNGTHTETIGSLVTKWVVDYCEPSDDDVLDVLNEEPYDPEA